MRVPNGTFMQMAWFVDDIHAAMRHWVEHSGVGPFYYGTRNTLDITHRGMPQKLDFSGAIAQAGPIQIELLTQYDAAPSAFRDVFAPAQGGPHHMGSIVEDYDRELANYLKQGFEVAHSGQVGARRFCFIDTRPAFGIMTELLEDTPDLRDLFGRIAAASIGWDGTDPYRDRSKW
jgi:hypothetical protein